MKDFSRPRERLQFTIDGDTFEAASAVPAEILVEFANQFTDVNTKPSTPGEQFATITAVLQLVLLEESYKRLTARTRDLDNSIKLALDLLVYMSIIDDDRWVDDLHIRRGGEAGKMVIEICRLPPV